MDDEQEVVIVDKDGTEHVFPSGFNPKRAAAIVRAGSASLPSRPFSAEDYAPKPSSWPATIGDAVIGAAKGVGSTLAGIGETAVNAGVIPGVRPAGFDSSAKAPILQQADDLLEPTNEAQRVGKRTEFATELAIPAFEASKGAIAAARAVPAMVTKAGPVAMEVASHLPIVGKYVKGARLLGKILDMAGSLTAEANTGGRVVERATPTLDDAIAQALENVRAPEQPAKITLPPEPSLPPGYTPRTTVPKPKLVKPSAAPPPAEPAAPPKRAYFLKSEAQLADERAARTPIQQTEEITPDMLPDAWKSRIGQDIFPTTGAEGKEVQQAIREEITSRGLSIGQAIAMVSRNKQLPVALRAQLLRALSSSSAR